MKYALSAAVALGLGIGLAASADARTIPGTDMQAGASAPARQIAASRHQQSRKQVLQTQRMLKAQGLYRGRIDGVMNQQTQAALSRSQRQQKPTHRIAALRQHPTGTHRLATLQKQHKPATRQIARSSRQTERNTMSGSSQNLTPTPTTPPATQAPNAGGNDQKY
jgi:peptidoglycan hydrolase-like protein with peptidoglycan-binding domain